MMRMGTGLATTPSAGSPTDPGSSCRAIVDHPSSATVKGFIGMKAVGPFLSAENRPFRGFRAGRLPAPNPVLGDRAEQCDDQPIPTGVHPLRRGWLSSPRSAWADVREQPPFDD
jgi:hypothetical protein